jgi:hypothetical protein
MEWAPSQGLALRLRGSWETEVRGWALGFALPSSLALALAQGTKKKPERPRTSTETIQKSTHPPPFFFLPDLFFYRIFRRFSASGVQEHQKLKK